MYREVQGLNLDDYKFHRGADFSDMVAQMGTFGQKYSLQQCLISVTLSESALCFKGASALELMSS